MTGVAYRLALTVAVWLVVGALLWVVFGGAVGEAAVLLLAALVLVLLAAVVGRDCAVCCETRRLRS
jgi:hypothetical protein